MLTKRFRPLAIALILVMLIAPTLSAIPAQAATASATPCLRADFVSDVTVKDRTRFEPGTSFIKTWRLRNSGTCTWNKDFTIVFFGGHQLSRRTSVRIREEVKPGRTVDVSVRMRAPDKVGEYMSYWMLRSNDGRRFGVGSNATKAFWAHIQVSLAPTTVFSFANRPCNAAWHHASGGIPCGGDKTNSAGYVGRESSPKLENGIVLSGLALVVHPQWTDNGEIRGRYDEIKIQKGDRFQATIGCLDQAKDCDVTFELRYRIQGESARTLRTWRQTYDGNLRYIDLDLSSMAGKNVKFFLIVKAKGDATDAWAAWVNPRIVR